MHFRLIPAEFVYNLIQLSLRVDLEVRTPVLLLLIEYKQLWIPQYCSDWLSVEDGFGLQLIFLEPGSIYNKLHDFQNFKNQAVLIQKRQKVKSGIFSPDPDFAS